MLPQDRPEASSDEEADSDYKPANDDVQTYEVGAHVDAIWSGDSHWYAAEVLVAYEDGTYDVVFLEDGIEVRGEEVPDLRFYKFQ